MKGFKDTGNGPKAGFSFPSSAGFGDSSGKSKTIGTYSRRAPKRRVMKKAVGGLATGEAPDMGWADFKHGGKVAPKGKFGNFSKTPKIGK